MGRQRGPLKVTGTFGDISFYKSQDGYMVREKGGVDRRRIKSDPAFKRTRENGQEFGQAGKSGKLLRVAFRSLLLNSDNRVVSRLVKELMKVIHSDPVGARGMRTVMNGNLQLIADFEFNIRAPLSSMLYAPYVADVDFATGVVTIDIPQFNPSEMLHAPGGTSHFKIVSGGAAVDFDEKSFSTEIAETPFIPWNNTLSAVISHVHNLGAGTINPKFVLLGVSFYQEVNGQMYELQDGGFSCRAIVKISTNP